MSEQDTVIRTYGNWRRPRSPGVFGLGTGGTVLLIGGAILALIVVYAAGILAGLAVVLADATIVGLLRTKDRHGKSLATRGAAASKWLANIAAGNTIYRGGPVAGRAYTLPGAAASTGLLEDVDASGDAFAVVHAPRTQRYTVVLTAEPDGASLVDREQLDSWVAHWGQWLASLGDEPGIVGVSVTIETAPDTGMRLRREVTANIAEDAPEVAKTMLREVVDAYPGGSATVKAYVAVSFTAARRRPSSSPWRALGETVMQAFDRSDPARSAYDVRRDIAQRLPALAHGLQATGAGAVRPMTAQALSETVRGAYDPDAQECFDDARQGGDVAPLGWSDAGPSATKASWDHLRHDGAWSVTWAMTGAPRGEVHSRVLESLLSPHPDIDRKRVTLLYRPVDAGEAARIVESDQNTVRFLLSDQQRPSQRLLHEQAQAQANAEAEARGAGLVNFALLVTATVTSEDRLAAAKYAVEPLASRARVTLRPVYGAQAAAFAAALPIGETL